MPLFGKKSLTQLQEDDDRLTTELSIARKRALIRRLDEVGGQGAWKMFSSDGTKRGVNFDAVKKWLREH